MNVTALRSPGGAPDAEREPFSAYILDDETTEALAPIVMEKGWETSRIHSGGIANAVRSLAIGAPPHLLIIDLSDSQEPLADITALAEVCEPGTMVIALGKTNDVTLYRDLMAAGVYDYLVKPVTGDDLRAAIAAAEDINQTVPETDPLPGAVGRITTVIGTRGGVGASTAAINVAWSMAHDLDHKVALLDLDVHFGSAALAFDLEPGRGLYDALENPGRVDGLFIERAMVKESEKLWILSSEAPLGETMVPNPAALDHLLGELRNHFRSVILDLPRGQVGQQQFVLGESKQIVIVADLTLSSLRDTIRLLALAKTVAPEVPIILVANRVAGGARDEVSQRDFENAVERPVDAVLPLDVKATATAAKTAKAIGQLDGNSKLNVSLRDLARTISGEDTTSAKKPFWQRLKKKSK